MSAYYKRVSLNRLGDFQTAISDLYVTDPIQTNVQGPVELFKTFQPEEYLYNLFGWPPVQILTGSNDVHPAYCQIIGLPQQEYPIVPVTKEVKDHVQAQRDARQLVIWHFLKLALYVPIANGEDHTIELYDPETNELQDSFALTTPVLVSTDSNMKSVINNPNGAWHVQFNFLTSHAYAQTGPTLITRLSTAMRPVSLGFAASQQLPD